LNCATKQNVHATENLKKEGSALIQALHGMVTKLRPEVKSIPGVDGVEEAFRRNWSKNRVFEGSSIFLLKNNLSEAKVFVIFQLMMPLPLKIKLT